MNRPDYLQKRTLRHILLGLCLAALHLTGGFLLLQTRMPASQLARLSVPPGLQLIPVRLLSHHKPSERPKASTLSTSSNRTAPAQTQRLAAQHTPAAEEQVWRATAQAPNPQDSQQVAAEPDTARGVPDSAVPESTMPAQPTGLLINSEATRQALRQAAREPLLYERAAQAMTEGPALRPEEKLGQQIASSATSDCLKGQFLGGGMGLLSLPFWALAEARGKCRR